MIRYPQIFTRETIRREISTVEKERGADLLADTIS